MFAAALMLQEESIKGFIFIHKCIYVYVYILPKGFLEALAFLLNSFQSFIHIFVLHKLRLGTLHCKQIYAARCNAECIS